MALSDQALAAGGRESRGPRMPRTASSSGASRGDAVLPVGTKQLDEASHARRTATREVPLAAGSSARS